MSALRTIHSSYVDLDPSEYRYAGAFDAYPDGPVYMPAPAAATGPVDWDVYDESRDDARLTHPGLNPLHAQDSYFWHVLATSPTSRYAEDGPRCDHCGARLRYVAVMRHLPTDSYMQIGETCYAERFSHDSKVAKDLDRLHKRAAAARALAKVRREVDAWLAADPANREAVEYAEANREHNAFYADLLRKLKQYGPWSERQRDAVLNGRVRDAERAARAEAEAAEPRIPVPEGRYTIEGEVVSVKVQDNDYGTRIVMTVKDARGFLVWGTRPSSLAAVERGDRVRFDAAVTRSDRDESFGFFKRPTKAVVIDETEAA